MKASELRIGNWVEYHYPHDEEWDRLDITLEDLKDIEGDLGELFRPLPLTEKWLLGLGFELLSGDWVVAKNKNSPEFTIHNKKGDYRFTPVWCVDYKPIKYVHQLQNLYYALTGEELTFTPNGKQ